MLQSQPSFPPKSRGKNNSKQKHHLYSKKYPLQSKHSGNKKTNSHILVAHFARPKPIQRSALVGRFRGKRSPTPGAAEASGSEVSHLRGERCGAWIGGDVLFRGMVPVGSPRNYEGLDPPNSRDLFFLFLTSWALKCCFFVLLVFTPFQGKVLQLGHACWSPKPQNPKCRWESFLMCLDA